MPVLVTAALAGDQGWTQIGELGLAFALTSLIGLEREWRHKPTGLRTHTLVGVGAALFVLVSTYGFSDVPGPNGVFEVTTTDHARNGA
jgi:putative Mg2+ transporter-C (MgtC) family protein